jgi:hypothetical protein
MITRAQVDNALATVSRNLTLDADNRDLCHATMCAAFGRFTDYLGVDAHSTASALNTVAVFRRRCALATAEAIEASWVAARLVGVGNSDKIVVDSVVGGCLVAAAGGKPFKAAHDAAGYVLFDRSIKGPITLAPASRLAVIRATAAPRVDDLIENGQCIATVTLECAWIVDLYEEGTNTDHHPISIPEINKTAGDLLDIVPARSEGVRRLKNTGSSKARPIKHSYPSKDPLTAINDIYDNYEPEVATVEGSKRHPAALIQSKTLAGATPVPPSYEPLLDPALITSGAISDIQFEAIVLAGEAHDKHLPYDPAIKAAPRLGFLLADGTGAGKTNSVIGIILDQHNRGRRRAVIIGEKDRHKDGILKALSMCGLPSNTVISMKDYKARAPLPKRDGILFLTYAMLRSTEANGAFDRVKQIVDWLGKDFDGVIAMDESQNMRNGLGTRTQRGTTTASLQARAGILLQEELPEARVCYVSATGSTLLENLAYMTRLGLWGPSTPYETVEEFMEEFESAGLSGMEAITAHIKSAGLMVCRQLSLAEVTYEELTHVMSADDEALFDAYTRTLMDIARLARECAENSVHKSTLRLGYRGWRSLRAADGEGQNFGAVFGSLSKRMVDTLIVSIKTSTIIRDIHKALGRGEACVIQLQNTFEAELNRAIASGQAYESDAYQATSELIRFVEAIPDYQIDSFGRPRLDRNGHKVPVIDNVYAKRAMLERIRALPTFTRPLEQLFAEFGTSRIAEMTGRTRRLVPINALGTQGDPDAPMTIEQRNDNDRRQDWRQFMADQKQIIVFSAEAGGTGLDYHASLSHRNQRLRRHLILQVGHRADQVVQGPGRSHRSAQKQAPVVVVVRLDLPAEKVYTSAVVAKMASLGALSQGHRAASANGLFTSLDTYNSSHALAGWEKFVSKLKSNQYPELKPDDFAMLGYFDDSQSGLNAAKSEFLKRAATLPVAIQRAAFQALDDEINNHIMIAIGQGNFDTGPETMRDTVTVLSEEPIFVHPHTGARIIVSRLACDVSSNIAKFDEAYQAATFMRPTDEAMPRIFFNQAMADVWIEYDAGTSTTGFAFVQVIRPDGDSLMPKIAMRGKRIEEVTDHSYAEMLWNNQADRIAAHRERFRTMITGALPLAWTHLQQSRHAKKSRRLWVAKTDQNSRLLGFLSNEGEVEALKIKLNQMQLNDDISFQEVATAFHAGKTIVLSNSMIITPQMVKAAIQQTLNTRLDAIAGFRDNAKDLGLCVTQFSGLEFFTFPADRIACNTALKKLIAMYGLNAITDAPDWNLIS